MARIPQNLLCASSQELWVGPWREEGRLVSHEERPMIFVKRGEGFCSREVQWSLVAYMKYCLLNPERKGVYAQTYVSSIH
jgi:hypothetical protein